VRGRRADRLVVFTGGATLYVLSAETGARVASICLDPRRTAQTPRGRCRGTTNGQVESEASPVVVTRGSRHLRILVGTDVHNTPSVGRTGVTAVDLDLRTATLRAAWKYDPEGSGTGDRDGATYRPETVGDVVTHGSGTGNGCGGVWGTPAVDVARDLVVLGTSSCRVTAAPGPDGTSGTADDVVADVPGEKVDAVRLSTGAFRWRFSAPRAWGSRTDDDFGASPQLFSADTDHDGSPELVAGAGGKDGSYYALDALTGRRLWASHAGQSGHTYTDFAIGGVIGSPAVGSAGGKPAVFATTAVSTPVGAPLDPAAPAVSPANVDASLVEDPARLLSLHALDAATGAVLWRSPLTRQTYAHPTYVNGVVLVPSTVGLSVAAFDAGTGMPLWASPVSGPPSSGVAVTARGAYLGVGTRQTDAGFKLFGTDSSVPPEVQRAVPGALADLVGSDPQERVAGIWAFQLAGG
jgi:outer membrane protein assembly factor BamB